MIGNCVADAKRMFKHACAFSGCANFCKSESWNIEHRLPDYSVAGIVNSAFACEVFIKSLLVFNGVPIEDIVDDKKRGVHKIADLWKMLETKDPSTTNFAKQKMLELFSETRNSSFYEMLDNISDAFVYWRYIYEKSSGKIHLNFLTLFRTLLQELCCEKYYGMTGSEYTKGVE